MPPRRRSKQNAGLPERWRWKNGAFRYQVPKSVRHHWDGKTEFTLGKTLGEAYRVFSERITVTDDLRTMEQVFDRYVIEITPTKSERTASEEVAKIRRLRAILGNNDPASIRPVHIYDIYAALKQRGLTTANRHMETLSHVFTKAVAWGVLDTHPMIDGRFRKEHPAPANIYYSDDQILDALKLATPMLSCYVRLKLTTGLRRTDLLRLLVADWKDDGLHVTPSKTANTTRRSLIFDRSWSGPGIAQRWTLEQVMADTMAYPEQDIRKYLFVSSKGTAMIRSDSRASTFESAWRRWMAKVEKAHGFKLAERYMRNKAASDSDTLAKAAEMLAHSTSSTTSKYYRSKPIRIGGDIPNE